MKIEVHDVLKLYFERKRLTNPQYSLRALARDLDVSPAYASTILSGKKALPESRLKDFISVLDLDDIAVLQLKKLIMPEEVPVKKEETQVFSEEDKSFFSKYRPLDKKKYEILNEWYNIAIMDLTTCVDFKNDSAWISKKLKITQLEVEIAIDNLTRLGLLVVEDGMLKKSEGKLRFPTKNSQSVIRKFHKQMIKKAADELDQREEDTAFNERLITGSTFAINPDKISLLKEKLQEALYEASALGSEGDCHGVYQLNIQFFPLTK